MKTLCKFLLGASLFVTQVAQSASADVTLRLATPKPSLALTFEDPLEDVEISAHQLDQLTGTTEFSTLSDGLFSNLAQFRSVLRTEIIEILLLNPDIKSVEAVTVGTNPLAARLALGLSTTIPLELSGVHALVQARAAGPVPLVCPTVNFTTRVDASGSGNFNISNGILSDIDITTDVEVLSASCSGLLSFIGGFFNSFIRSIVEDKIESGLREFLEIGNISTFLSLEQIASNFNFASLIPGQISAKVQNVLTNFILNTQNSFLQIDVELRPDFFGAGSHSLSLIASNGNQPRINFAEVRRIGIGVRGLRIDFNPGNAPNVNIFARRPGAVSWTFLAATTTSPLIVPFSSLDDPEWPANSEIMMISENFLVPGLMSFPVTELVTDPEAEAHRPGTGRDTP